MTAVPFHYLDLRAFAHATEAEADVRRALGALLAAETELDIATSEGHFGQPIRVLSARLETADEMRTVLSALADLPTEEGERLRSELDERVDEDCTFYVTLDKQAAARGEVRLGDGITLRGKVEAYPAKQDAAVENAREALEAL